MKKELKKYLEEMIEDEWNRYRSELLEESSRKIEIIIFMLIVKIIVF